MITEVKEIPIDNETDDLYFIYFLYDTLGHLLYIGKTTKLRQRMRQHLVAELVKLESWRNTIDRNNIVTIKCNNACDLDLYETYFINKYNPIYNKDKIFNSSPTFDLPYIESVIYKFKLKVIVGNGSFKDNCINYIENEEQRLDIYLKFPLIKEAYEKLGSDKMRSLSYNPQRFQNELAYLYEIDKIKNILIPKIEIGKTYLSSYIKEVLNNIYKELELNKNAKSTDIENYFEIERNAKRYDGILKKVLTIIKRK